MMVPESASSKSGELDANLIGAGPVHPEPIKPARQRIDSIDQLTGHLKTPDFFDVAKYPKANFVSTRIEPSTASGATHSVTGNFDLHGVKKSITFPATITVTPDDISVNAEFAINRKDFALLYPGKADDLIRDGVVIKLTLKVSRKT